MILEPVTFTQLMGFLDSLHSSPGKTDKGNQRKAGIYLIARDVQGRVTSHLDPSRIEKR